MFFPLAGSMIGGEEEEYEKANNRVNKMYDEFLDTFLQTFMFSYNFILIIFILISLDSITQEINLRVLKNIINIKKINLK